MSPDDSRREVAALGDFFVVEAADAPGAWRGIDDLVAGPALAERVEATRAALERVAGSTVEPRVANSTASLGLFARLLSPPLGARLLGLLGPAPAGLQWRAAPTGPLPLRGAAWWDDALERVLADVVAPLAERLTGEHGLAETVVRGNVASAVMGSLRMAVTARPDLAPAAGSVATELFATPLLTGTSLHGRPFVRRSCCLYYRLPGGGYCGDCILAPQHRERVTADAQR
ncbi:(2Fe-2S)-binding protein [Aeromicrobium sp. CF4.19]|uniref:(2Fe-2S)-binding protein n=1 Tax=Aeromicrobium sp. CF4.19 TaxID=3373082 RepID=UPI003EE510E2